MVGGHKEFKEFFKEIQPELEELELVRLEKVEKVSRIHRYMLIGVVVCGISYWVNFGIHPQDLMVSNVLLVLLIFGTIIGFVQIHSTRKKFKMSFKYDVMTKLVKVVNPSLVFSPEKEVSKTSFTGCGIFNYRTDRYRGEDHVAGTIDKTHIEFSEITAQEKRETRDSKGRRSTHYHTFFRGLFVIADFNKEFRGRTVVLPDTAEKSFGWLGKKLQKMNMARDQLVNMENTEFEKEFVVYSTDQVEARYILSTSLIDRILELKKKLETKIHLSFSQSRVFVAIETSRNFFDPKMDESLIASVALERFYNELMLCVGLVEDLNLNMRIWTKE